MSFHRLQMPSSEPTAHHRPKDHGDCCGVRAKHSQALAPAVRTRRAGLGVGCQIRAAAEVRLPPACTRRTTCRRATAPSARYAVLHSLSTQALGSVLADRGARLPGPRRVATRRGPRGGRASLRVPASRTTATTLAHAPTLAARLSLGLVRLLSFRLRLSTARASISRTITSCRTLRTSPHPPTPAHALHCASPSHHVVHPLPSLPGPAFGTCRATLPPDPPPVAHPAAPPRPHYRPLVLQHRNRLQLPALSDVPSSRILCISRRWPRAYTRAVHVAARALQHVAECGEREQR